VSPPGRRAENQVALVLSESSVPQFLAHVLSMPEATIGIWRIEVFPMKTALFRQPLHKMPAQKITFTLRLQRRASADYAPDHKAMLQANQAPLLRLRPAGGKSIRRIHQSYLAMNGLSITVRRLGDGLPPPRSSLIQTTC